jgi:hypothetical protein
MSYALPLGGRSRRAEQPRWARLDGLSQLGVLSAVTILFCVSGGMLWIIGYNYDGLTGSAATKIHPSTYLICLIFAWSVLGCGDPVSRTIHLANRRPGTLLMLAVSVAVMIVTILREGPGLGGIVDTYIAACLLVFLLADADEPTMARLEQLVHLAMAANALMALVEFLLQVRFFPYRFDGIAFETDTRSAALHGHPLANAMVTACYLMALLNGRRVQPAFLRAALIALQFAALVVFGGRTALLISLFFGGVYGMAALLRSLQHGRISLLGAAVGCFMAAFVPAAVGVLVAVGFFDDVVARFISDGGSANARAEMFTLLGMFSFRELILGPDTALVDSLRRVNGLEWGIENPFIRMTLYQGLIVTALVTVAFGTFMYEFARVTRGGLWLPMIVWIVLLNGSESIASKTTLPAQFAVIVLCLYRPDQSFEAGEELRAARPGRASG